VIHNGLVLGVVAILNAGLFESLHFEARQSTYPDAHEIVSRHVENLNSDIVEALEPSLARMVGYHHRDDVPAQAKFR
jgi:hypothetical protein